jgi:hypothetical protein
VGGTKRDLVESGWQLVDQPQTGDVLIWEAQGFDAGPQEHIGFSIGNGRAVSLSWQEKVPVEHDQNFGTAHRNITQVFRLSDWE